MHSAYEIHPILDKLAFQIESVVGYSKVLLLGTKQGHIWRYAIGTDLDTKLSDTFNNFSKKPLIQLFADTQNQLLISLSDNLISIHDLEKLTLITTIIKTKGATYFCVDHQEINILNITNQLRICVLVRKKLQFYIWKNKAFVELYPDITLPDIPKSLLWYKNSILYATKSDYSVIEITSGSIKDLFPAGKNGEPRMCLMQLHSSIMTKEDPDKISDNIYKVDRHKNTPSPTLVDKKDTYPQDQQITNNIKLTKENSLDEDLNKIVACLCKDDMTILMDLDNYQINKTVITWTDPPLSLKFQNPYLFALIPQGIEVRTVQPRLLIQDIAVNKPKGIEISRELDKIFVWTSSTLYLLTPHPINDQISRLIKGKHYDLALHLSNVSNEMRPADRDFTSKRIKVLYARNLFNQKRFRESMAMFSKMKTEPRQVINLFPNFLPAELATLDGQTTVVDDTDSTSTSHKAEDKDGRSKSLNISIRNVIGTNSPTSASPSPDGGLPSLRPTADSEEGGQDDLQGAELDNALLALVEYLTEMRAYLISQSPPAIVPNTPSSPSNLVSYPPHPDSSRPAVAPFVDGPSTLAAAADKERDLQIVDTTLLKCYLQTNDALVGPLLRIPTNYCHTGESERMLKKRMKFNELLILYQRRGLHRKSLDTLLKHSKRLRSPLFGNSKTVSYLQHLGPQYLDLIFEYAGKIIKENPGDGLKIFIDDVAEVEALNREKVLYFLIKHNTDLIIPYLEYVIFEWKDETVLFHNTLINQYREKLQSELEIYRSICQSPQDYENLVNATQSHRRGKGPSSRKLSTAKRGNSLEYEELVAEDATEVLLPEDPVSGNVPIPTQNGSEGTNQKDLEYYETRQKEAKIASRVRQLREKLRTILEDSTSYMPETLVINFPIQDFNVERALLFGRLGRHDTALAMYCHILNDFDIALAHCKRYYDANDGSLSQLYFTLFSTLIDPPDLVGLGILPLSNDTTYGNDNNSSNDAHQYEVKPEPDMSSALKVLSDHAEKIPITKVLEKLPDHIPLSDVVNYIVASLKSSSEKRNSDQMLKGLLFSKLLRVQEEKFVLQSQKISLSDENTCKACKKRIGASAFVLDTDKSIVHYYCFKEAQT